MKITVYVWGDKCRSKHGHCAIEIQLDDGRVEYISFIPENYSTESSSWNDIWNNFKLVWSDQGTLEDKLEDLSAEHREEYKIQEVSLSEINLDAERMYELACEFREKIQSSPPRLFWGLGLKNQTCSSLTLKILESGKLKKLIPTYGRHGHPYHLLLLSLRIPMAISITTPFIYEKIVVGRENKAYLAFLEIMAMLLGTTLISIAEKNGLQKCLPFLSDRVHRKRELVEIANADIFIQISTLMTIGIVGMIFREELGRDSSERRLPVGVDFLSWIGSVIFGCFIVGFLFSKLLYFSFGLSTVVRPSGVLNLTKYLQKIEILDQKLIQYNFYKEMSMYVMGLICCTGNYVVRHFLDSKNKNFFIDIGVSLPIGYLASKLIVFLIEKKENAYCDANHLNRTDEIKAVLKSHSPRLGQFAFVGSTTAFLMMLFIELSEHFFDRDDAAIAFGLLGCLLGYVTGQILYDGTHRLLSQCSRVVFFATPPAQNPRLLGRTSRVLDGGTFPNGQEVDEHATDYQLYQ